MGILARAAPGDRERVLGRPAVSGAGPDSSPSWTSACTGAEVIVSAPGPDERMNTTDDIVVGGPQGTCTME